MQDMMVISNKRKVLTIFFIIFISLSGFSQNLSGIVETRKEVADSVGAFYFYDSALVILNPVYYHLDTALHLAHHYQALQRNGRSYASLGNTGLAYTSLKFSRNLRTASQYGIISYDAYRFTPENIPYYKLNVPFTLLAYTTGKDREQIFRGNHYQQVRRNLGVGLNFNIYNSMGSYERTKSDNASIGFQAHFRTNDKRYGVAANFISNRFIHRENGGLQNPLQFEENRESDRSRISVMLNNAENRWRETNTYFKQHVHLTNPKHLKNDSVHRSFKGFGTVVHTFNYQRLAQVYYDRNPRTGYYREILNDSLRTHDTIVLHTVSNELLWNLNLIESDLLDFSFSAGIGHVFMHSLSYRTADTTANVNDYYHVTNFNKKYNQLIPFFRPQLGLGNRLLLEGRFQRITGEFRNGDQELGIIASYKHGNRDPLLLRARFSNVLESPGLFYHLYKSNHFEWENSFGKQKFNEVSASVTWRKTTAGVSLTTVDGFVYLDTLAYPAWFDQAFNVFSAFIDSRLEWRRFIIGNKITYQKISDEAAIRLPELIVNSTISYELDLFQGALQAMGGVEIFYNSPWRAPAYMPALRSFYLQDVKETGNYVYADVFLNLRIKRARIFFLMQHVNEGLLGYNFYMIPNYPMPDRAFKFGVNWIFYD